MLLSAIGQVANGEKPPMWLDPARAATIRGPITVDGMGPTEGWQSYWKECRCAPPQRLELGGQDHAAAGRLGAA